jgi:hypothetical protein
MYLALRHAVKSPDNIPPTTFCARNVTKNQLNVRLLKRASELTGEMLRELVPREITSSFGRFFVEFCVAGAFPR